MKEKYINLAKKLIELAKRGVDGEKINAQEMLNRIMEKHGITFEDIEEETKKFFEIRVMKKHERLFCQVLSTIVGNKLKIYNSHKQRYKLVELTTAQYIELECKFNFYKKVYDDEMESFFLAFIHVNGLLPNNVDKNDIAKKPLTPEEQNIINKAVQMIKGLNKNNFQKRLTQ